MMKIAATISLLLGLSGCVQGQQDERGEALEDTDFEALPAIDPNTGVASDVGFVTHGCTRDEDIAAHNGWNFLFSQLQGPQRPAFEACIRSAVMVEGRSDGSTRYPINAGLIVEELLAPGFTDFTCLLDNLPNPDGSVEEANAPVGVPGNVMRLRQRMLRKDPVTGLYDHSVREIAAIMAHELMHNRGYEHAVFDFGTPLGALTVPYQVQACVLSGASNQLPPGPLTVNDDLRGSSFHDASLQFANLAFSMITYADFIRSDLRGANLVLTSGISANFNSADLTGSSLVAANLQGANFENARLVSVNLEQADLRGATFGSASIDGSTNFIFAAVRSADLTSASLAGARYNASTHFPPGFDPAAAGMVWEN